MIKIDQNVNFAKLPSAKWLFVFVVCKCYQSRIEVTYAKLLSFFVFSFSSERKFERIERKFKTQNPNPQWEKCVGNPDSIPLTRNWYELWANIWTVLDSKPVLRYSWLRPVHSSYTRMRPISRNSYLTVNGHKLWEVRIYFYNFLCKVHIFWEGHKNLKECPSWST